MASVTLHLRDRRLDCEGLDADESRDLNDEDFRAFARWVATYGDMLNRRSEPTDRHSKRPFVLRAAVR